MVVMDVAYNQSCICVSRGSRLRLRVHFSKVQSLSDSLACPDHVKFAHRFTCSKDRSITKFTPIDTEGSNMTPDVCVGSSQQRRRP